VLAGQAVLIQKAPFDGADGLDQVDVSGTVTIPPGLQHGITDYKLCVILDAEKNIAKETNPANNAAISKGTLTVQGALGGCFEDAADKAGANNDSPAKALPLPAPSTATLGSCGNDDWWKVAIEKGDSLVVTLQITPGLWTTNVPADLDIELYAPDGKTLLDVVKVSGMTKKASALTVAAAGD
jgi:hypothetical protein